MAAFRRKRGSRGAGDSSPGDDSFLDIVANIVGILIILVMVAGVRVGRAPIESSAARGSADEAVEVARQQIARLTAELDDARIQHTAAAAAHTDIAQSHDSAAAAADALRDRLAAELAAPATFDPKIGQLEAQLEDRHAEADALGDELDRLRKTDHPPTLVTSYPTPVGREVDGGEAHFQLKGGRVAVVPLDRLLARFEVDARTQAKKLQLLSDLTSTVGPIGGFRLRYRLDRVETSLDASFTTGRRERVVRLTQWELIPVASDLGETIGEALGPGSQFTGTIARLNPTETVVTLWTYPDSFEIFRQLRALLYEQGYSVAARPLPEDQRIAGSPGGSKSVAQ
jgi:hypothetical protein